MSWLPDILTSTSSQPAHSHPSLYYCLRYLNLLLMTWQSFGHIKIESICIWHVEWLTDCMVFNAVSLHYFHYIMVAIAPIHAFLEFFQPVPYTIFYLSKCLLFYLTIVETMDNGEREMNPVAMTVIKSLLEWLSSNSGKNISWAGGFQVFHATDWAMGLDSFTG